MFTNTPWADDGTRRYGISFTLFVYLARRYLAGFIFTLVVMVSIIALLDVVENFRKLGAQSNSNQQIAFVLTLLKLPSLIQQVLPFIVLLGTLLTFTRLSRDEELTALRASGLSARQFLLGPLMACMLVGALAIGVLNPLAATLQKRYERMASNLFPGAAQGVVLAGGALWLRQTESTRDMFIYAQNVDKKGEMLTQATVFVFNPQGDFMERLDAQTMQLTTGVWQLANVIRFAPREPIKMLDSFEFATTLTPAVIRTSFSSPQTLSVFELAKFINVLKSTGFPTLSYELQLQRLLALPALMLGMFLLAAPFAMRFSRRHGVGQMVLAGLLMGFGFYLFGDFASAWALGGQLPVNIAAWLPTCLAALIGLALFIQFREE